MFSVNIRSNANEVAARFRANKGEMERAISRGMRAAKEPVRDVLKAELRSAFNVKQERFLRTWRIAVRTGPRMVISNLAKGFDLHASGGTIRPRSGSRLLIPMNTTARIGTKKFYSMIDWLRREKMTLVKDGILFVRVPMNTSRRGAVAVGSRVNKKFRQRFSGPRKRPSGFDIKLNSEGLTPIAVIRPSITMRKRIDMQSIVRGKLVPLVMRYITDELRAGRAR